MLKNYAASSRKRVTDSKDFHEQPNARTKANFHQLALVLFAFAVAVSISYATPQGEHVTTGELLRRSGDAYIRQAGTEWFLGTAKVEEEIALGNGHLSLVSFRNKAANRNYVQGSSYEIHFGLNGREVTGGSERWILDGVETNVLAQGELLLQITLHDDDVQVEKDYRVYPQESIIQQWMRIKNTSPHSFILTNPFFLQMHIMQKEMGHLDFSYMTGGMCFWGSWILKTQPMTESYARHFDATDQPECLPGKPCPKGWLLGNSIYAPIDVFFNRQTKDGVFVGWDYLGRWGSYIGNYNGGPVNVGIQVSGYKKSLSPGDFVVTPRAFVGVFTGDLDNMGNQLLDYQYRYKWDYTRGRYFAAVRMLGYWWNGATDWPPGSNSAVDYKSTFLKVFRTIDLMRYVGADIFWRDYGWWDVAGKWSGPNFGEANRYLQKYGMKLTLYTIPYNAELGSSVVLNHPDWLVAKKGNFSGQYYLNQAIPGVTDFELKLLNNQQRKWGSLEWRMDDSPLHDVNGDDTPMLAQAQNFQALVKDFLNQNPKASFHGCNGGGNGLGYEALRLSSVWQMSDGCVGRYRDYYTSYLFPPDKLVNQPDNWNPNKFQMPVWRKLLWTTFAMTGDTFDPAKLEGLRRMIDIYHYLRKEGVAGRWVKVYHPRVSGDDPSWYLQRMSRDNLRGIIIPTHSAITPATVYHGNGNYSLGEMHNNASREKITIFPKGLISAERYNVSYQFSKATANRTGSDLMRHGISMYGMKPGELIYFNLPMHPGSAADKIPPSAPGNVWKDVGTNMGYIGVELNWTPATDNNWVSYYKIYRDGVGIDKIAKGTYYFDHSAGADLGARYEVQAVDGSGNKSERTVATGGSNTEALIADDANPGLRYTGKDWKHEQKVWSVFDGTQSSSHEAGDAVEYSFRGNRIAWYGRLGAAMGKADVYIDGAFDRTVDCYDADKIPNVVLYSRTFPMVGAHTLRIVIRGDHRSPSKGNGIFIDGIQVGRTPVHIVDDARGSGIFYSGKGWKHGKDWPHASGKSISWTGKPGDAVEFTFHGRAITWIGKLCPACGRADVYIDSHLDTTVDTYERDIHAGRVEDQGGWQAPLYEKSWAEAGEHTIRIVVRSDKDALSSGRNIYLDSFQISGQ